MKEEAKAYQYKNTTEDTLVVIGVGEVEAGKTITSSEPIENPNLEPVEADTKTKDKE